MPRAPMTGTARLLGKLAAVFFAAEVSVHLVLPWLPRLPHWLESLVDALAMIAIATPAVYCWILRPERLKRRDSEEMGRELAAIVQSSPEAVVLTDAQGTIWFVNRRWEEMSGWTAPEVVGKVTPRVLKSGKNDPAVYGRLWSAIRRGETFRGELVNRRKDGTLYEVDTIVAPLKDPSGGIAGFYGIERDITEEQRAREALRGSQSALRAALLRQEKLDELRGPAAALRPLAEKLAGMLDVLLAPPWFGPERRGAVFLLNGASLALEAQVGLSEACLARCRKLPPGRCVCGRSIPGAPGREPEHVDAPHQGACEELAGKAHLCLPIRSGDELLGTLALLVENTWAGDEGRLALARAAADIIASAVALARSEAKFAQAQRMDAVGRLAGGVAHDFNNLLTVIQACVALLKKDLADRPQALADVKEITSASDRAALLTRQLLAFSRRQTLEMNDLDLNEEVSSVATMLRRVIGEDVALELRSAPGLWTVKGDAGQISQVIMNLAINARDAMPSGGRITIATANVEGARESPERPELPPGDYVALTVADTGTGIAPDVLPHVFEPFFTTKEKGKGSGLGLAMVYGTVKQSGGSIYIASRVGAGTTVEILLPRSAAPDQAGVESPEGSRSVLGRGETVLLVEDDASVGRVIERGLAAHGFKVLAARGGEEAQAIFERERSRVALLVTDVVMPAMNGAELARRLRRLEPGLKVLFVSGYADQTLGQRGILEKGVDLLLKPFTADQLAERVRRSLDAG